METKKRLSREQKREQAVIDLINQMFIIAGHEVTYDDILGKEKWFQEYSMTVEQGEEFKKWGKKYLMKNLRTYAKAAAVKSNLTPEIAIVLPLNLAGLEVNSTGLTVIAPCAIAALARATMLNTNNVIFFIICFLYNINIRTTL